MKVAGLDIVKNVETGNENCLFLQCDLTDEQDVKASIEAVRNKFGRIDIVVHAIGAVGSGPLKDLSLSDWLLTLDINLTSAFLIARETFHDLKSSKGSVVFFSSTNGLNGGSELSGPAYAVSKAGIINLSRYLAKEWGAFGIRVNTVAPGLIDTPIYGEGEQAEAFKEKLGRSVLFPKRLGVGEELAFTVMECITNPYMNAEVIRMDGGIRMPPK
jgi:NAD(P)-dependent dehydrogenase (short-subunit alcohol dehydrogenase family)